jgi:hypothetical protein
LACPLDRTLLISSEDCELRMTAPNDELWDPSAVNALPLERYAIRTRGTGFTRAAWRLRLTCDQGEGAIVLAEISSDEFYYRGEGIFLGWPQDRLESLYRGLLKDPGEAALDTPQLG